MGRGLTRLVRDVDLLLDHWEVEPLVSRGLGGFDDVFSLVELERLLLRPGLPASTVRLMQAGDELDQDLFSAERERSGERQLCPAEVVRLVAGGATVLLEELQTLSPTVRAFTDEIRARTGWPTYTTAFLTPPGSSGAPAHYDLVSVFVRQVNGSKRWRIGRPAPRWPVKPWHAGMRLEFDEILDVTLDAGDCLYLPRGYPHVAEAGGEASLHVSIGLVPTTWQTVLRRLLDAGAPAELRQALPFSFHTMTDEELYERLTTQLGLLREHIAHLDRPRVAGLVRRRYAPGEPVPEPPPDALRAAIDTERRPSA